METPDEVNQPETAQRTAQEGQVQPLGKGGRQKKNHLLPSRAPGSQDEDATDRRAVEDEDEAEEILKSHPAGF